MKKRIFIFLVLVILVAGGVFGQALSGGNRNWASGEVGLIGAGLRYERMLTDKWSIGGTIFFNSFFFIWNSVGFQATGRYYPWSGNFYAEAALGFGWISGTDNGWVYDTNGVMLTPGVGWKIDLGEPGAFFINPSVAIPVVFGKRSDTDKFKVGYNFKAAFGMGYAF